MKTIKDFKNVLCKEGVNTLLGQHLNSLFNLPLKADASVHNLEEKVEVIGQMYKNGIDVFKDQYVLGSVTKAFHQWKLSLYTDYK